MLEALRPYDRLLPHRLDECPGVIEVQAESGSHAVKTSWCPYANRLPQCQQHGKVWRRPSIATTVLGSREGGIRSA